MTEKKLIRIRATFLVEIEDDRQFQEEHSCGKEGDDGAMYYDDTATVEYLRENCSTIEELYGWVVESAVFTDHKDNIEVEDLSPEAFEAAKKELP